MSAIKKNSVIFITGYVEREVQENDGVATVRIKNADGVFYIKVYGYAKMREMRLLQKGDYLLTVGYLESFWSRAARSSQVFVHAVITIPLDEPWPNVWDDVGVSASLQAIYAKMLKRR